MLLRSIKDPVLRIDTEDQRVESPSPNVFSSNQSSAEAASEKSSSRLKDENLKQPIMVRTEAEQENKLNSQNIEDLPNDLNFSYSDM